MMANFMIVNREPRPIAAGWEHPRDPGTYSDGSPRYRGLFSRADLLRRLNDPDCAAEGIVDPADYMPEIPEGSPYMWVLYETTSEGTPISPPFATLEDLAAWCETRATACGSARWTRDQWMESFADGGGGVVPLGRA